MFTSEYKFNQIQFQDADLFKAAWDALEYHDGTKKPVTLCALGMIAELYRRGHPDTYMLLALRWKGLGQNSARFAFEALNQGSANPDLWSDLVVHHVSGQEGAERNAEEAIYYWEIATKCKSLWFT